MFYLKCPCSVLFSAKAISIGSTVMLNPIFRFDSAIQNCPSDLGTLLQFSSSCRCNVAELLAKSFSIMEETVSHTLGELPIQTRVLRDA